MQRLCFAIEKGTKMETKTYAEIIAEIENLKKEITEKNTTIENKDSYNRR